MGCAEDDDDAAEDAADAAAEEDAAECSLVEAGVAPALTGRWITGARLFSVPLAARMTTTGHTRTPSDASDASSSCSR